MTVPSGYVIDVFLESGVATVCGGASQTKARRRLADLRKAGVHAELRPMLGRLAEDATIQQRCRVASDSRRRTPLDGNPNPS